MSVWMYVPILVILCEAVAGVIFGRCSNVDSFRTEVGSDVMHNLVFLGQTVLEIYDCLTL